MHRDTDKYKECDIQLPNMYCTLTTKAKLQVSKVSDVCVRTHLGSISKWCHTPHCCQHLSIIQTLLCLQDRHTYIYTKYFIFGYHNFHINIPSALPLLPAKGMQLFHFYKGTPFEARVEQHHESAIKAFSAQCPVVLLMTRCVWVQVVNHSNTAYSALHNITWSHSKQNIQGPSSTAGQCIMVSYNLLDEVRRNFQPFIPLKKCHDM